MKIGTRVKFSVQYLHYRNSRSAQVARGVIYGLVNEIVKSPKRGETIHRRSAFVKWDSGVPAYSKHSIKCLTSIPATDHLADVVGLLAHIPLPNMPIDQMFDMDAIYHETGWSSASVAMDVHSFRRYNPYRDQYRYPLPLYGRSPAMADLGPIRERNEQFRHMQSGMMTDRGVVTGQMLTRMGACDHQVVAFIKLFPDGVIPTLELCVTWAQDFDFGWAARNLLSCNALEAYSRFMEPVERRLTAATEKSRDIYAALLTSRNAVLAELSLAYREAEEDRKAALKPYKVSRATIFFAAWKKDHP